MYVKLFIIVLCLFAKNEICRGLEDCDLNLSQIFRTPKDFSKVNFDNLEILERGNFDSSTEQPPSTNPVQNEICKRSESFPKSIANAQVMLRFGRDDNRLETGERPITMPNCHQPHPKHYCKIPINDIRYTPYPPCAPHSFVPEYPHHSAVPEYYYPYPPPPPYVFPGCYYRLSPEFRHPQYYGLPHRVIEISEKKNEDCIHRHQRRSNPSEKDFLEVKTGRIENRNHPEILQADDLSDDTIQKINSTEVPDTIIEPLPEKSNQTEIKKEIKSNEFSIKISEEENKTELAGNDIQNKETNIAEENKLELIGKDAQETGTNLDSNSDVKSVGNESEPSNITKPVSPTVEEVTLYKIEPESACLASSMSNDEMYLNRKPSPEMEAWLNKSLVTYSCKNCDDQNPRMLVSYPIENSSNETRPNLSPEKDIERCCCQKTYGSCKCGNCERNPDIPYGQRFMVDIDSLVGLRNMERTLSNPKIYSSGFTSSSQSSLCSSYSKVDDGKPKIYLNGYNKRSGSSYYSDPTKEVYYREPTIIKFLNKPEPTEPVVMHTKVEIPHIYKVVPKFQIVPINITNLDIPDLVPTNRYICPCCKRHHSGYANHYYPTNHQLEYQRDYRQRDYLPRDYHQRDYYERDYHPKDYHQRDYLPRNYQQKDYHPRDYHQRCYQQRNDHQRDYYHHPVKTYYTYSYCPYCSRRNCQADYTPIPLRYVQEEHIPVRRECEIPHDDFLEYHLVSRDIP